MMTKTTADKYHRTTDSGHQPSRWSAVLLFALILGLVGYVGFHHRFSWSESSAAIGKERATGELPNHDSEFLRHSTAKPKNSAETAGVPGSDPGQAPFDPEKFYAGLSLAEKKQYRLFCLDTEKAKSGGDSQVKLRSDLAKWLYADEDSPRQQLILRRIKDKCQKLAGLEDRLFQDINDRWQRVSFPIRTTLPVYLQTLAATDPQKATELFLTGLTSNDATLRYTFLRPAVTSSNTQNSAALEATILALNDQLGLDFFHPQQQHGVHLLTMAAELASCQRSGDCGPDSFTMLRACLHDEELCSISLYEQVMRTRSPADMEYIDSYLQFLLSRPAPPPGWEDELLLELTMAAEGDNQASDTDGDSG